MGYIMHLFGKNKCVYCRQELEKERWRSEWGEREEHHYKSIRCACGKKNWLRVDFSGSGHDFTFKKELSPLESTVKKVYEK